MDVFFKKMTGYDAEEITAFYEQVFEHYHLEEKLRNKTSVLIKPNLLGGYHPDAAITTHPAVVEPLIMKLKNLGKKISLGDSPGGQVSVEKIYRECGYYDLCLKHGVELLHFGSNGVKDVTQNGYRLQLERSYFDVDAVINICKYKTHSMLLFTGAVKNLYGLIPGLKKAEYHKMYPNPNDFSLLINALYNAAKDKIVLNVTDAIVGMEGTGPAAGKARFFGSLMAAEKASGLDYIAQRLMGFKHGQIMHTMLALNSDGIIPSRLQTYPIKNIEPFKNVDLGAVSARNFILRSLPKGVSSLLKKFMVFYPVIGSTCLGCGICVSSCPVKAITFSSAKKYPIINYDKCIKCMCCHELCPEHAVYVQQNWLAKKFF